MSIVQQELKGVGYDDSLVVGKSVLVKYGLKDRQRFFECQQFICDGHYDLFNLITHSQRHMRLFGPSLPLVFS